MDYWVEQFLIGCELLIVSVVIIVIIGTFCIAVKDLWTTCVKKGEKKYIDKNGKV